MKKPFAIDSSWWDELAFRECFSSSAMSYIQTRLLPNCEHSPKNPKDIFKAYSLPVNKVRIVILGQDPYPNVDDATGLAFGIPRYDKLTYSLKEICKHLPIESFDPTMEFLHNQGVLLLNTSFTCEVGKPDSHKAQWKDTGIIDATIEVLNNYKVIWMLWGSRAKEYRSQIQNPVFEANHPAGVRYGHTFSPQFDKVKELIKQQYPFEDFKWVLPF